MSNEHVLDTIQERCTGMQRPDEFERRAATFESIEEPIDHVRTFTPDRNEAKQRSSRSCPPRGGAHFSFVRN